MYSKWLAGVLALFVALAPAAARDTVHNLSSVDVFTLAEQEQANGHFDAALTLYDALSKDPDDQVRAEARFRKGMLLSRLKRWRDAAIAFRAVLDEKPDAARVRLELARVLLKMGDEAGARRQLRQAEATGLPPEVAVAVGRFDRALRAPKRFGGSFELALAPDSNINRATQARVLDTIIAPLTLSSDARAKSGIGLHVAGQTYGRIGLGSDLTLIPQIAGVGNIYRDSSFNDISVSALVGLEKRSGRDRFTASAGKAERWFGARRYSDTSLMTFDWLHPVGKLSQIETKASVGKTQYPINPLQNGMIYNLGVTLDHAISARSGISAGISGTRQTAADPAYATTAGGASLTAWREAGHETLFASAEVRHTDSDAAYFLFGKRRNEWLFDLRAGATFRGLSYKGFAPYVRLSFERNKSTIALYDYKRVATEFGITRAF